MTEQDLLTQIIEAKKIACELNQLLRDDSMHRLRLYQEYTHEQNAKKWSPDLYHRCQLMEALCRKLDNMIKNNETCHPDVEHVA